MHDPSRFAALRRSRLIFGLLHLLQFTGSESNYPTKPSPVNLSQMEQDDQTATFQDGGAEETVMTEQNVFDDCTTLPDQPEPEDVAESKKKSKKNKKKKSKSKDKKKKKRLPPVEAPEFVRWERRNTMASMVSAITIPKAILTDEDEEKPREKSTGEKKKKKKSKRKNAVPLHPPGSINCVPEPNLERELSIISIPSQFLNNGDINVDDVYSDKSDWRISDISIPRGLEVSKDSLLGPL